MLRRIRESKLRKYKNKAADLVARGKYRKALAIYQDILTAFPKDTGIMLKVGDLCRRLGMDEEAVSVYLNAMGHYAADGRLLQAIAVGKIVMEIDPGNRVADEALRRLYREKYGRLPSYVPQHPAAEDTAETADAVAVTQRLSIMPGPSGGDAHPGGNQPVMHLDFTGQVDSFDPEASALYDIEDLVLPDQAALTPQDVDRITRDVDDEEHVPRVDLPMPAVQPEVPIPDIPLFSDLDEDVFAALVQRLPVRRVEALETIVEQGDVGDSFFIILSGSVEVFRDGQSIAVLEEGAFFGEMAVVLPGPRSAQVVAAEPCVLFEVSKKTLDELVQRYPQVQSILDHFTQERLVHNLVHTSPLFAPFTPEEREDLLLRFVYRTFSAGDVVHRAGEQVDGLHLVLSGEFAVRMGQLVVSHLRVNDLFGDVSLLARQPSAATIEAVADSRTMMLPASTFYEVIMTHPQILAMVSETAADFETRLARKVATSEGGGSALL